MRLPKLDWTGDTQFRLFDKDNLGGDLTALERALRDVYAPIFPYHEDYHSWQSFIDEMETSDGPIDYSVVVAGHELNTNAAKPIGFVIGFYYKESDAGQLGYLGVDPNFRTGGIGHALYKNYGAAILGSALSHGRPLSSHYIACHNPDMPVESANDTYDALKRFRKYEGWGARKVQMDYLIGYTRDGEIRTMNDHVLMSMPHPVTGEYATNANVDGFVHGMWRSNGIEAPQEHSDYRHMIKTLYDSVPSTGPKLAPK